MSESESSSNNIKMKLEYPFEWAKNGSGEKAMIEEIEFSRPKGKHIKGIGKDVSLSDLFRIAGKVSGYTPGFFDEMDVKDCMKVTDIISDFLDDGQETGRTN